MFFTNMNSAVVKYVKYFVYKYIFTYYDWFGQLHVILKKIECYVINSASTDDIEFVMSVLSESYVMKETHAICLMYMHNQPSNL